METVNERLSDRFLLSICNDLYIIVDHAIRCPVSPDLFNQLAKITVIWQGIKNKTHNVLRDWFTFENILYHLDEKWQNTFHYKKTFWLRKMRII